MNKPTTYRASDVTMILGGSHIVSGFAEDSFISIQPQGGGNTMKVGADGEVVRDQDTSKMYKVNLNLLHGSKTCAWLDEAFQRDKSTGNGMFDIMVKDLSGVNRQFDGRYCCLENLPNVDYNKSSPTHSYTILVASGEYK